MHVCIRIQQTVSWALPDGVVCVWARERYVRSVTWWHYWCEGIQSMLTEEDEWLCEHCQS